MKSELVAWLLQILDEDQATALAAQEVVRRNGGITQLKTRDLLARMPAAYEKHSYRWIPPRVLADIEAKRAVVEVLDWQRQHEQVPPDPMVIRVLATAYAYRPGYRDEWWPADEWKPRP